MLRANVPWMTVNLVLAGFPVLLALWLFRAPRPKNAAWWLGAGTFLAFLPNAPYVFTDIVHFPGDAAQTASGAKVGLLALQYGALIGLGLACYAVSPHLVHRWVSAAGYGRRWLLIELGLHGLCSVGIFLGRFVRLNSWDVVVHPAAVLRYVRIPQASTVGIIAVTFCVLVAAVMTARVPLAIHELRRTRR